MQHDKIMAALQLVAKNALELSSKFGNEEYAKIILTEYNRPRQSAIKNELQQLVSDLKIATDEAVYVLEGQGFINILERYHE